MGTLVATERDWLMSPSPHHTRRGNSSCYLTWYQYVSFHRTREKRSTPFSHQKRESRGGTIWATSTQHGDGTEWLTMWVSHTYPPARSNLLLAEGLLSYSPWYWIFLITKPNRFRSGLYRRYFFIPPLVSEVRRGLQRASWLKQNVTYWTRPYASDLR